MWAESLNYCYCPIIVQFTVAVTTTKHIMATGLIHSPLKVNNALTFSNISLICHSEDPRDKMYSLFGFFYLKKIQM